MHATERRYSDKTAVCVFNVAKKLAKIGLKSVLECNQWSKWMTGAGFLDISLPNMARSSFVGFMQTIFTQPSFQFEFHNEQNTLLRFPLINQSKQS